MSQPQLNNAMVLNVYTEMVDKLDLPAVANQFVGDS